MILSDWSKAETGSLSNKHILDRVTSIESHFKEIIDWNCNLITTSKLDELRALYLSGKWIDKGWKDGKARQRTAGGWNRLRRHLLALFRWAMVREKITEIPFKVQKVKVQEKVASIVWPEQVPAFLAAVDHGCSIDTKTAIRVMIQLGLREDEALGLRWEWFDLIGGFYLMGDAKDREVREIDLPPGLGEWILANHSKKDKGLVLPAGTDDDGNEFPHREGFTKKSITRGGEAIGTNGLTPHRLRATFATAHWEAGTGIGDLSAMLGHQDPQTTMGYIVDRSRSRREAQRKVAVLMGLHPGGPIQETTR
jgi:integrase